MAASATTPGYQEIRVEKGGTLRGKVTLKGDIPPPKMYHLSLSPFGPFCEKKISDGRGNIALEEFTVGPGNGLMDVVVAVQGVRKGKPFPLIEAKIDATDCMFHPADVPASDLYETDAMGHTHHIHPMVTVLQNHQPIWVVNKDPIFHNGQIFQKERGNIMLNFPLPISGKPGGGILHFDPGKRISQMICGMHEFMQTWGFVVDNPYYAKTRRDGQFTIDRLPPGSYRVHAWHPQFKIAEKEIKITEGGAANLNFEFDSSTVRRRTYESEKGIRAFH